MEVDSAVLASFFFYSSLLVLKMASMSFLTGYNRKMKNAFSNPEDAQMQGGKIILDDPDVERVRRAHLNDVENILPFFVIGLLYCFTNPEYSTANFVFKVFTAGRFVHTIVYAVYVIPQPSRVIAFVVGQICNIYLAVNVFNHFK